MKNRFLSTALLSGVALACALPVYVYGQAKPETLVRQRQSAMVLQGKYFGPLAGMAQGKVPYDANTVARNAGYLDVLNKMPWDGFHPNTKGEKSRALSTVFSEPGKFKEAQDRFQAEVTKLVSVSKGGDEASVKSQITAVQKSCAACHEDFREKQ